MSFHLKIKLPGKRHLVRLAVDGLVLFVLLTVAYNFKHFWFATTKRGFFCDDESLMYPYRDSTVSSTLNTVLAFDLPLVVLVILELCRCWGEQTRNNARWQIFWPVYNIVRYFLFGFAARSLLTRIGKHTVGRLRPHFFAVCQPLLSDGGSCSDVVHRMGGVYHTNYTCQASRAHSSSSMIRDVHVSFPSGHSSKAFYGLVFMALYLQVRRVRAAPTLTTTLLRPFCQLGCILVAWFVALSRVLDYKHHWSDVLAGSLLGAGIAFVVVHMAAAEQRLMDATNNNNNNNNNNNSNNGSTQKHANERKEAELQEKERNVAEAAAAGDQSENDLYLVTCETST